MAAVTPSSYGQRALASVLTRTATVEVAARCRVAPSRVSEWLSGRTVPSARSRAALWREYRIPVDAWDGPRRRPRVMW